MDNARLSILTDYTNMQKQSFSVNVVLGRGWTKPEKAAENFRPVPATGRTNPPVPVAGPGART